MGSVQNPPPSNSSRRAGEDTPSLRRVCARALRGRLDKAEQCSDWGRRPLTRAHFEYAALDAHVLLEVHDALVMCASGAAGQAVECRPCE